MACSRSPCRAEIPRLGRLVKCFHTRVPEFQRCCESITKVANDPSASYGLRRISERLGVCPTRNPLLDTPGGETPRSVSTGAGPTGPARPPPPPSSNRDAGSLDYESSNLQ